jgi:hypothetical protein
MNTVQEFWKFMGANSLNTHEFVAAAKNTIGADWITGSPP